MIMGQVNKAGNPLLLDYQSTVAGVGGSGANHKTSYKAWHKDCVTNGSKLVESSVGQPKLGSHKRKRVLAVLSHTMPQVGLATLAWELAILSWPSKLVNKPLISSNSEWVAMISRHWKRSSASHVMWAKTQLIVQLMIGACDYQSRTKDLSFES